MQWDTVIGLEVHAQLKTQSKLFSGASTEFGAGPNSHTSFIDAGLPGVLPVLNKEALNMAIQLGLALHAEINDLSVFERKNYFYPDLPKGYQISQYQKPIVSNGYLTISCTNKELKKIHIVRAHLEEDAGKSLHELHESYTGIDLNRAGTPLLEIVTAPCLYSADEAISYLKTLHQLVRFLGICDGNMQEGSFRCDVNISLKPKGSEVLGTRTEIKNLNSFKFIEKAIQYEQGRHQDLLESNQKIMQETRLYNPDTNTTIVMRSKENENDYRYFPDPDLLPVQVTQKQIEEIKKSLPQLPHEISRELLQIPNINEEDIAFVLSSPEAHSFYKCVKQSTKAQDKLIINWLKGIYAASLNEINGSFSKPPISAQTMGSLLDKIHSGEVTNSIAKRLFACLWEKEEDIDTIIQREKLNTMDDTKALEEMILQIIKDHPEQVAEYQSGKEKLLAFFVGQVMKQTRGQANPSEIHTMLKKYLLK